MAYGPTIPSLRIRWWCYPTLRVLYILVFVLMWMNLVGLKLRVYLSYWGSLQPKYELSFTSAFFVDFFGCGFLFEDFVDIFDFATNGMVKTATLFSPSNSLSMSGVMTSFMRSHATRGIICTMLDYIDIFSNISSS